METRISGKPGITISAGDFTLLEIVHRIGPCTTTQVCDNLKENGDLLRVMRSMHNLVDRGLLARVVVNRERLYKVKSNYKNIRSYLKIKESFLKTDAG